MKFSKYLILLSSIIFIDSVAMESDVKVVPKVPLAVLQLIAKGSINQNGGTEKEIFAATDKMVMLGGNSFRAVMNLVKLYAKQNDKPDNYNYGQFKADIMDYILKNRFKTHTYEYKKALAEELKVLLCSPDKNKILELLQLGADPNFSDIIRLSDFLSYAADMNYLQQFYTTFFQLFMYQIFCFVDLRISSCSCKKVDKYYIVTDFWGLKSEVVIEIIELLLQFGANPLLADRHGGLASAYIKLENTLGRMGIWDPIEYPKEKQPKILIFLNDIKKLFDTAIKKRNFDKQKNEPSAKEGKQEQN